jgi:dTDP-4-dehydrorhamnose reductase
MANRIGIIGHKGRLGTSLKRWYDPIDCDIRDPLSIRDSTEGYDVVINCAAKTNLDQCEVQLDECFAVNHRGAAFLRNEFKGWLIHLSTAYVFADEQPIEHLPGSIDYNPLCAYSSAKVGAEIYLSTAMDNTTIIRTTGLFGSPVKSDGLQKFLGKMGMTNAPGNLFSQSIHVDYLAESIHYMIENKIGKAEVFHLVHESSYLSRAGLYLKLLHMLNIPSYPGHTYGINSFKWEKTEGVADRPRHCLLSMKQTSDYGIPVGT